MAGKSRNVPKREPSDSRFSNTLEHAASMMSQNTTPRTMLNTPTLSNLVTKSNSIMTGLTGNLRQNTTIATGILDITSDSSGDAIPPRQIIVVDPEGAGTTDTLDAIEMNGVELEGAVITLFGVSGNTITITHNFTPAGTERAILCPTDMDFTLSDDDAIDLVYDKINTVWLLKSAGNGGGAAASFQLDYPVDRQGNKSGTVTHDLSLTTGHKLVFTATADCDITISNIPTSASDAMDFYIEVIQDSTGGWTITANDSEWVSFPTLGTTADTTSLIACHADGDGNIRAVLLLNAQAGTGFSGNLSDITIDTDFDANGVYKYILDADADTYLIGDTDDRIEFFTAGTEKLRLDTELQLQGGVNLDVNGNDVILDIDADTYIHSNGDDDIELWAGGGARLSVTGTKVRVESTVETNLNDLLSFDTGITTPVGSNRNMIYTENLATDELVINGLSGGSIRFDFDGTEVMAMDETEIRYTGNASGSYIKQFFQKYDPDPETAGIVGQRNYLGPNSIGNPIFWAKEEITQTDVTAGTEDSDIDWYIMNGGLSTNLLSLDGSVKEIKAKGALDMNGNDIDEIGSLNMDSKPDITGSRGGNAALADLLTSLASIGLITDSST